MDIKRKAARGIAVLAVALAAGHLVQTMGDRKAPPPKAPASAQLETQPSNLQTVASGPELPAPKPMAATAIAPLPAAPLAVETPVVAAPEPTLPTPEASPTLALPGDAAEPLLAEPLATEPVVADVTATEPPATTPAATNPTEDALACDMTLDLMAEPNAMIGVTLIAPCHANQRVVLRQGGLAVSGQTTSTGALFTALPAFETQATVEAAFADGTKHSAVIDVPELAGLRRFGVQWQADDAFQLHAFEDGADYGGKGHVSAADTHRPLAGLAATGGFLTLAGDSTTENPLLAEVYTFPVDPAAKPEVVVEAAVTEKTCGRELLAETLTSTGGTLFVTDLTLAMPECDAIGDYMVLKNLVLDLNMAAAN